VKKIKSANAGYWALFLVLAICVAPVAVSYFTYYVIKPQSRTNYGTLLDPRAYPMPELGAMTLDGKPISLATYKGKWLMLHADSAHCQQRCKENLFKMRQLRLIQGKEMDRLERIWLITDDQPLDTFLMRQYDGMHLLRVKPSVLKTWLPTDAGDLADHIYIIDPLGNLVMRFPKNADPNKVKRDIARLLKASRIG